MGLFRVLAVLVLIASISGCDTKKTTKQSEMYSSQKPNIIYMLADDLGNGDLGVSGRGRAR